MSAYEVRVAQAHALSLSTMRTHDTYVGEIVRIATGDVAYRTKHYLEPKTARLQAARLRKNYEHHLAKHGVGFEQQEAERKASERAAREAKRVADRRVRDAAPDLLAALIELQQMVEAGEDNHGTHEIVRAAIAKATQP